MTIALAVIVVVFVLPLVVVPPLVFIRAAWHEARRRAREQTQ